MARKKKKKKGKTKKEAGPKADALEAEEPEDSRPASKKTSAPRKKRAPRKAPKKRSASSKKAAPKKRSAKKKPARKKPAQKKSDTPEGDAPAVATTSRAEPADPRGQLPESADAEDRAGDVVASDTEAEPVVADVAVDPTPGEPVDLDEAGPLEDLDAVLDDELDAPGAIDRLIAQTVAGAEGTPDDDEQEPEPIVLDEEPTQDVQGPVVATEVTGPDPTPVEVETRSVEPPPEALVRDPVSTPEDRDRLLAQALAHAQLQDARYRVPFSDPRRAGRWKALAASLILLVAGYVAVAPPAWIQPEPPARLTATERAHSIRRALLLQAEQVEAFRVRSQRLPASLDEVPGRLGSIRFVRSGNRAYQLIAYELNGNAIVYDSSNPSSEFEALATGWIPE